MLSTRKTGKFLWESELTGKGKKHKMWPGHLCKGP